MIYDYDQFQSSKKKIYVDMYSLNSYENYSNLQPQGMQKIKAIKNRYRIQKTLFKVNNYLYARIFDKHTLDHVFGCVYVYENQQPGQILKMLIQKFASSSRIPSLIFPSFHVKDSLQEKSLSIFFISEKIVPLSLFTETEYEKTDIRKVLKMAYDGFCSLHYLHSHEIIHGNIELNTCYISKSGKDINLSLNILDTSIFKQDLIKPKEAQIFMSQSQQNGIKTSYKDDAQSMIYIILHLASKGKMLSKQRFLKEWVSECQLLRWKTMDFFKEMVKTLPPQLQFISEIYTIIKSLGRNQKPDYTKFIKKAFVRLKQEQNRNREPNVANSSLNHLESYKSQKSEKKKIKNSIDKGKDKNNIETIEEEQIQLMIMQSDNEQHGLQEKFSKLESTKCTVKKMKFWSEKSSP